VVVGAAHGYEDVDVDRRQFFKRAVAKTVGAGVDALEQRAEQKALAWIRPPFARPELDFLLDCSRCDACVEACPHQVIFTLPLRCGAEVVGTPALDLLAKACHLCDDWPCVSVCEPQALSFPAPAELDEELEPTPVPLPADCPPLALLTINEATCLPYSGPECGACRDSCPVPDTLCWENERPSINAETCVGCGLCRQACITEPLSIDVASVS
jgi:ferredoxin-type protein NapG